MSSMHGKLSVRRRGTVSRKPAKTQQRNQTRPKRSDAAVAARQANSSISDLQEQLERQARDLEEARNERAALAEVLRVISSSPGDLERVFQTMLESAVRTCEAKFGALYLYQGDSFRVVALHGEAPQSFVEARWRHPVLSVVSGTALGRVAETKQAVQIADVQAEPAYHATPAHADRFHTAFSPADAALSCRTSFSKSRSDKSVCS